MTLSMKQLSETYYDTLTKSLKTITDKTFAVLLGNSYMVSQNSAIDALDIAAPLTYHVTTPDTLYQAHLEAAVSVGAAAIIEVFEDDGNAAHFDVSAGDAVIPINRNRNSANVSAFTVASGVTVTQATADVLIYSRRVGGVLGSSGNFPEDGIILKLNTQYLIRVLSDADNNEGSLGLTWHELLTLA